MHVPVLLKEVIHFLKLAGEGIYIDGTVGSGGYTKELLNLTGDSGLVIGIDMDEEAIERSERRLIKFVEGGRLKLFNVNYKDFDLVLKELGINNISGAVLDLGVSSDQLEAEHRGFSFLKDGPLDMRMSKKQPISAAHVVNKASEHELSRIFRDYGEEKYARKIARAIVQARKVEPLLTTGQLVRIINEAIPVREIRYRIHPATRVFQALRIYVNQELDSLRDFLRKIPSFLKPGGVLCVVSFHSLEDRIVKHTFRKWSNPCKCPPQLPSCVCGRKPTVRLLTKRAVRPSESEVTKNPKARSARLRAVQKL